MQHRADQIMDHSISSTAQYISIIIIILRCVLLLLLYYYIVNTNNIIDVLYLLIT